MLEFREAKVVGICRVPERREIYRKIAPEI